MDLQLSEEQETLRASAQEFLARECTHAMVRQQMDDPHALEARPWRSLWTKMSQLGWLGLTIAEEHGGANLDLLSLSMLCQEMGRSLLPLPYLSTVAIGSTLLRFGGSKQQRATWLPQIAAGTTVVSLAILEDAQDWDCESLVRMPLPAPAANASFKAPPASRLLSGTKHFAVDAQLADLLIVPVRTSGTGQHGVTLYAIDANVPGVSIEPVSYTDATRRVCEVTFSEVALDIDRVIGERDHGWPLLMRTLDYAKVALCAEMLGGALRVHEESVAYAKHREQFGKPIGSFQAIAHKCANQFIAVEGMRSAVYYAAWAVENNEPDAHVSACLAKAYCSDAYTTVTEEAIQIHGGIGFTWEQDLHLYYKRAKASQFWLGDARFNRELAARALLD